MTTKFNQIVKETEKAMLVNINVYWGSGKPKAKDIWFPKSTIEIVGESTMTISDTFAKDLGWRNAFKGYLMYFADQFSTVKSSTL